MKRREFISLAGLAAVLGLPWYAKAAQSQSPAEYAAPTPSDPTGSLRYQGVRSIPISQSRQIVLPSHFNIGLPFYIVGLTDNSDIFICLAICELRELAQLKAQVGNNLCVYSEHRTFEPTLSGDICEKFSLAPGTNAWLIAMGNYLELWSEKAFDDMLKNSVGHQPPDGFAL